MSCRPALCCVLARSLAAVPLCEANTLLCDMQNLESICRAVKRLHTSSGSLAQQVHLPRLRRHTLAPIVLAVVQLPMKHAHVNRDMCSESMYNAQGSGSAVVPDAAPDDLAGLHPGAQQQRQQQLPTGAGSQPLSPSGRPPHLRVVRPSWDGAGAVADAAPPMAAQQNALHPGMHLYASRGHETLHLPVRGATLSFLSLHLSFCCARRPQIARSRASSHPGYQGGAAVAPPDAVAAAAAAAAQDPLLQRQQQALEQQLQQQKLVHERQYLARQQQQAAEAQQQHMPQQQIQQGGGEDFAGPSDFDGPSTPRQVAEEQTLAALLARERAAYDASNTLLKELHFERLRRLTLADDDSPGSCSRWRSL